MTISLRKFCIGILIALIGWRVYIDRLDWEVVGFAIVLLSLMADAWSELRYNTRELLTELFFRYVINFGVCLSLFWVGSFIVEMSWKQMLLSAAAGGAFGTLITMFWGFVRRG